MSIVNQANVYIRICFTWKRAYAFRLIHVDVAHARMTAPALTNTIIAEVDPPTVWVLYVTKIALCTIIIPSLLPSQSQ